MMSFLKILVLGIGLSMMAGCGNSVSETSVKTDVKVADKTERAKTAPEPALLAAAEFQSTLITKAVKYHIYLPSSYENDSARSYPVVYWLHGSGGFPPGALNMLATRFDQAIDAKKVPEMIVVFPDGFGQSMWLNAKDNTLPMEDIFIQELIPHMDTSYRTIKLRDGRMLEGGSMGGYGSARFGFKYPDLFVAISMLNPGPMQETLDINDAPIVGSKGAQDVIDRVFGGDMTYFQSQSPWRLVEENADKVRGQLIIRMILGELDEITRTNQAFSERMNAFNIDHDVVLLKDAGHNPRQMFNALGDDYWEFFNEVFAK